MRVKSLQPALDLNQPAKEALSKLGSDANLLESWEALKASYSGDELTYRVRGKEIHQKLTTKSLCGLPIRRVALPDISSFGDRLKFLKLENVPGFFPYTAGVFPLREKKKNRADSLPVRVHLREQIEGFIIFRPTIKRNDFPRPSTLSRCTVKTQTLVPIFTAKWAKVA